MIRHFLRVQTMIDNTVEVFRERYMLHINNTQIHDDLIQDLKDNVASCFRDVLWQDGNGDIQDMISDDDIFDWAYKRIPSLTDFIDFVVECETHRIAKEVALSIEERADKSLFNLDQSKIRKIAMSIMGGMDDDF